MAKISQTEKAQILEQAVIDNSPEEISELCRSLGFVEFSARALGLACRFRELETVKAVIKGGATFEIPKNEEVEKCYCCYAGMKYDNYRSNFSLYLLNISKHIKGACCFKGLKLLKQVKKQDKTSLRLLSDSERAAVLKYLCNNKEKIYFDPSEMLYYAIFAGDNFIVTELKKLGITLSEKRRTIITEGGMYSDGYWYEYTAMTGKLSDEEYIDVMTGLAAELEEKKFYCTEKIYDITKKRFVNREIFEFFRDNFKFDKLNKTKIIRGLIDENAVEALPLTEEMGWLSNPKKRDEMIEYSQKNNRIECTAWLLDFKNRTADFAAEQEKEEKKQMKELSAAPDSVLMLKKIWSYKKQEDGTLIITNYKGIGKTEVIVPEKIGKSIVTAIGNGAFAGASGVGAGSVIANFTHEQMQARRKITKITLPKTLKYIGRGAFTFLNSLKNIEIPEGVKEIEAFAFNGCDSLREITIPGSVEKIGKYAFAGCSNLQSVKICEGVLEIDVGAFSRDINLKKVELPRSLQRLLTETAYSITREVFDSYLNLTVRCPKGSYAESYCKKHIIKFEWSSTDI